MTPICFAVCQLDLPPSGPTSRVYFSQRLQLPYVDWGNPAVPPLVLLHGGCDHCRDWVAAALRDDHHMIAPDLRGHRDSAWSASGHDTMASNPQFPMNTVARCKSGLERFVGRRTGAVAILRASRWHCACRSNRPRRRVEGEGDIFTGGTADYVGGIKALQDLGVNAMYFRLFTTTLEATIDNIRRFQDEVMAKVR